VVACLPSKHDALFKPQYHQKNIKISK
jgi:hypothetical protein